MFKIDTDGYYLKILPGTINFIRTNTSAVLFECDAFSNTNYVAEFLASVSLCRDSGYKSLLVYDNSGNFMGTFNLLESYFTNIFTGLLNLLRVSKQIYFDMSLLHGELAGEFTKSLSKIAQ
jgi:hypothetical protein